MSKQVLVIAVITIALMFIITAMQAIPVRAATLAVVEPENDVHASSTVSLAFIFAPLDGEGSPTFYYILDGQAKVYFKATFNGSLYRSSIYGLTEGDHNLFVYSETFYTDPYFGTSKILTSRSEPVQFTVNTINQTITPSPATTPIQTPAVTPTPSPSPTLSPTHIPSPSLTLEPTITLPTEETDQTLDFAALIIAVVIVLVFALGAMFYFGKRKGENSEQPQAR